MKLAETVAVGDQVAVVPDESECTVDATVAEPVAGLGDGLVERSGPMESTAFVELAVANRGVMLWHQEPGPR